MSDDLHSANTTVDEAKAFMERHADLPETQRVMGGMAYGLLRALMECPHCPGHFRVPLDRDWASPGGRIVCPNCRYTWVRREDTPEEAPKVERRNRRKLTTP